MITLEKYTHSDYADRHGINNTPNETITNNCLVFLTYAVEPLEKLFEDKLVFHSGYRCNELNKALKGKPNSQHLAGNAIDFTVNDMPTIDAYKAILNSNIVYDQLIIESSKTSQWIHMSYATNKPIEKQRMQALSLNV